jgi:hypothetical protein
MIINEVGAALDTKYPKYPNSLTDMELGEEIIEHSDNTLIFSLYPAKNIDEGDLIEDGML